MHPVTEAVLSGKSIEKEVFKQGLEGPQFRNLMALLKEKDVPCQFVPAERLNKIDKGGRSQGVVAYMAQIDYTPFEEAVENAFRKSDAPVFVMLDGVSDVRNLGAIARTAECAGVSAIILPAKGGAAINAEAIKVSAGALLRIDTCKTQNLRIPIYYLKERGFQVVAATEKTDSLIYEADFKQPTVIVMGSEGKGISDSVMKLCDAKVKIPMHGEIESLNVSVATSIILFEVVRQRL
jgi:23S rRNA (guanosine2251-2'-O)-methyltransferase